MDSYEATRIVLSRIQKLDPENATKIIGSLLIQDHGEKEMIRLAFGPESLLHSVILKARKDLGLFSSSNNGPLSPSAPCSPLPFSHQNSSNTRVFNGVSLPSPLSIPNPSSVNWAAETNFSDSVISPSSFPSHYNSPNGMRSMGVKSCLSSTMNSSALPFYGNGDHHSDVLDEFQVPFLSSSPDSNVDSMLFNSSWSGMNHRRGCSVSDVCLNSDDPSGGFGWKPCLYFAKGYCKNGANCRFVHGHGLTDSDGISNIAGSPHNLDMMEQCQELLGSNSAQQQRFAAASHLMSGGSGFAYSPRAAAALMIGDEMNKFSRSPRFERSEFAMLSPGSRQIYLTFPADSTFREEDVSNYFSIYGPVQDVRIPYQQKRMFGFVTFVYPDTVKLILAKGNPHFICDARVLVKPYKEKGKVPEKFRRLQNMDRGDFLLSTGLDSQDPFDMQLGARMLSSSQDALWRKRLEEQADLEHAIEIQNRRLVGLRLLDMKTNHHRAFSTGTDIPAPTHSPNFSQQNYFVSPNGSSPDFPEDMGVGPENTIVTSNAIHSASEAEQDRDSPSDENSNGKESLEDLDLKLESMVNGLPEHLFASPKAAGEYTTTFSMDTTEPATETISTTSSPSSANLMTSSLLPASSTLDMASLKSCYFQSPRLANHGAIRM